MDGGGVAELDVLGHVPRRQAHLLDDGARRLTVAVALVAGGSGDGEGPVAVGRGDVPEVTVADVPAVAVVRVRSLRRVRTRSPTAMVVPSGRW